jgi:hypothetical protein
MQMLSFEENGSIFCEWCLPQTSVHSEEALQRAQWPGGAGWPPMDGVMTDGYGQRFGERLRVESARAMFTPLLRSVTAISALRAASPIKVISRAFSSGSLSRRLASGAQGIASE